MIESFLIQPFLAIFFIAISASLLGVFTLWKKISYFGDSFSHAIILGFVLGAICNLNQFWVAIIFITFFCSSIALVSRSDYFSHDTIITILSYFSVALAIILSGLLLNNFNIGTYILGDVLAVENFEVGVLGILAVFILLYSLLFFEKILLTQINQDFAKIAGVKTEILNFSFLLILAGFIACAVKIVGILLMTALLIMPAAIARIFAKSPRQMMFFSLFISIFGAILSFVISGKYSVTISSILVVIFGVIFFSSLFVQKIIFRK